MMSLDNCGLCFDIFLKRLVFLEADPKLANTCINSHILTSRIIQDNKMGKFYILTFLYWKWSKTIIVYQILLIVFCFKFIFKRDCGVLMLKCIEYLISCIKIDFSQEDITSFRQKYCIELNNGQLSI